MLSRLLTLAIIAGGAYWYWSGPYQERTHPTYGQQLQHNTKAMEDCMQRKNYAAGRTATSAGHLEEICAKELNFYFENGHWYSYSEVRRD